MKQKYLVLVGILVAAAAVGLALSSVPNGETRLSRLLEVFQPRASAKVAQTSDSSSEWVAIPRSNLKPRQDWFLEQRSYPKDAIPAGALQRALRQREGIAEDRSRLFSISSGVVATTPFTGVGPSGFTSTVAPTWGQMSGRTRDIAIDPTNAMRIFLATASGGIWRSTNGGTSWTPLTDTQDSLAASAVAIDPSNVNTIYAGTGEGPEGAYFGVGILKSIDGGATWTLNAGATFARHAIGDILVHPTTSTIVLACSTSGSHTPGPSIAADPAKIGVFRSIDGGASFTQTSAAKTCLDLIADPSNFNNLFASLGGSGDATDGLYKSTDAGITFTQLAGGAPTGVGRIVMGISANGMTLYAGGKDGATTKIWKSLDGGATWAVIAGAPDYCESQCGYDNAIAVAPGDANVAFFGGVPMYRTLDGGTSFVQLGDSNTTTIRPLHVDHHILEFAPGSSTTLYDGNDGGLYVSTDAQATTPAWTSIGGTLATLQPYNVALHPTAAGIMLSGFQDNGTELRSATNIWSEKCGGDGGIALIDHTTPTTMYCSFGSTNIGISKSANGGLSFPTDVSVPSAGAGDRASFIPPLAMDPVTATTIFAGTQRLWRTTDGGATWAVQSASGDLTGGGTAKITKIAIAPSLVSTIMVITSDGLVKRSTDSGVTFANVTAAPLPGRFGTTVVIHPTDPLTAYVGFSGFNDGTPGTPGHIFKTTDGGATWTDVTGNLPDTPVNAIAIRPDAPTEIYAGTDVGTFLNTNGATAVRIGDVPEQRARSFGASADAAIVGVPSAATTWTKMSNGLPNAAVIDIQTNATTNLLAIATYGRSVFTAALNNTGSTPPTFAKAFAPASIISGGTSTLTFTINNTTGTALATALAFTDTLPAGVVIATPANASASCTGGTLTAVAGTGVISYSGSSVPTLASCQVAVNVTSTAVGMHLNTTGNLTSSSGNSGTAAATLTVTPPSTPPTFDKAFAASIAVGSTTKLILTINNTASALAATALAFTDSLPAGVVIATPANASTTCTGGTLTATAGAAVVTYTGGSVAAAATCKVDVDVTSAAEAVYTNTTGDLTSSNGNSGKATAMLTVIDDGDGVPAAIENGAPNGGDGNGDATPDAIQSNVTSLPSATTGEYLTMVTTGGAVALAGGDSSRIDSPGFASPGPCVNTAVVAIHPSTLPADDNGIESFDQEQGLLSFEIPCFAASVTIIYHGETSLFNRVYRKYGPTPTDPTLNWYTLPATFGTTTIGGNVAATATLELFDGQLGDDDLAVNNRIVDQGGPGTLTSAIPSLGGWALGLLALLLGIAGWVLVRRL